MIDFTTRNTKGELVEGHFCSSCLPFVDRPEISKANPSTTDVCIKCEHRADGRRSTAMVGDWLILGKSTR